MDLADSLASDLVTDPRAMRISVKGDILSLSKPSTAWVNHFEKVEKFDPSQLKKVTFAKDCLSPLGLSPARTMVVFGVSSIESCFGYHVAKGTVAPVYLSHSLALTLGRYYRTG